MKSIENLVTVCWNCSADLRGFKKWLHTSFYWGCIET